MFIKSKLKNEEGFSLIEVLVAIGLFSIGSLAVVTLYYSTTQGIRSSNERSEAVFIAENFLNQTLARQYTDTGAGCTDCMKDWSGAEGKYNVAVTVDRAAAGSATNPIPPAIPNTAIITVTVSWGSGLNAGQHTLQYLRAETRTSGI